MQITYAIFKHEGINQPNMLRAGLVEMKDRFLLFYDNYKKDNLVFKVKLNHKYNSIKKALKDLNIEVSEYR